MRPLRWAISAGRHGQSRWCNAISRVCTLVPAPIFWVLPIRTRTVPFLTFPNSSAFFVSVSASWMNWTSSFGMPLATSLSRTSLYTSKPSSLGVLRSQKIIWVDRCALVFSHISYTLSTQALALLPGSSGNKGFMSRWSSASFLPSLVMRSILSSVGCTFPFRTFSARSAKLLTILFWTSLGCNTTLVGLPPTSSGTGRCSISAV